LAFFNEETAARLNCIQDHMETGSEPCGPCLKHWEPEADRITKEAALIAAAPAMFEALELAVETLSKCGWGIQADIAINRGRAALASAVPADEVAP
jgi:hypothetical protein